jgi:ABC-type uncharacterized transport system substrate-binding protein
LRGSAGRIWTIGGAVIALSAWANDAWSHPHVFAEARLEVIVGKDGTVESLRHVWRFDDLFSSSVLLDFDSNADNLIDGSEAEEIGKTIKESTAEFNYFHAVTDSTGKDIAMNLPGNVMVDFSDNIMTILFETKPATPVALVGRTAFGIYDPTFYTAIDFYEDSDMVLQGAPAGCTSKVVRPDPEEAIAQNQQNLTDAFYETTDPANLSQILATRLEVTCP